MQFKATHQLKKGHMHKDVLKYNSLVKICRGRTFRDQEKPQDLYANQICEYERWSLYKTRHC